MIEELNSRHIIFFDNVSFKQDKIKLRRLLSLDLVQITVIKLD